MAGDVPIGPDRHDPAVADGQGARPTPRGVHGRDAAAAQDEVGGLVGRLGHDRLRIVGRPAESASGAVDVPAHPVRRDTRPRSRSAAAVHAAP